MALNLHYACSCHVFSMLPSPLNLLALIVVRLCCSLHSTVALVALNCDIPTLTTHDSLIDQYRRVIVINPLRSILSLHCSACWLVETYIVWKFGSGGRQHHAAKNTTRNKDITHCMTQLCKLTIKEPSSNSHKEALSWRHFVHERHYIHCVEHIAS